MCNIRPLSHLVRKTMAKVEVFSKVSQTSKSMSRGQTLRYHVKGLVSRNAHLQYEIPIFSSKKVKLFEK